MPGGRGRPGRKLIFEDNPTCKLRCPACGVEGHRGEEFANGSRQGHPCKPCSNARGRAFVRDERGMARAWRRERYERNQEFVRAYKRLRGCESCPEDDPICLDFHHRDPAEKRFSIALRVGGSKKETLLAEMEKCIVLCRNCHAKLHWGE